MSNAIEELVLEGYRNIIFESEHSHEEKGGFQTEYTEEIFVAENDGNYFRITVTEKKEFGPRGGISSNTNIQPISRDEYDSVAASRPRIDEEMVRAQISEASKRDEELKKKLRASAPRCPQHDLKMRLKKGAYGQFWGVLSTRPAREPLM